MKLNPKYVVDQQGQRSAVLLPVDEYEALLVALEDRLDAGDLEEAIGEKPEFVPYAQIRDRLLAEGET